MKETLKIRCASCGRENLYEREMVVKAEDEAARNALLNGSFFTFQCRECGKLISCHSPILYFDGKNRYMILMTCGRDTAEIDQAAASLPQEFHLRKVPNLMRLQEMIYCMESGLDHRIVEILKRAMKTDLARNRMKVSEIFFSGVEKTEEEDGKKLVFYCTSEGPERKGMNSSLPFRFYEKTLALFGGKLQETGVFQECGEEWAGAFTDQTLAENIASLSHEEHCHCHEGKGSCHCDE